MKISKNDLIGIGSFIIGCVGLVLSGIQSKNDRQTIKDELKKDILLEMKKGSK